MVCDASKIDAKGVRGVPDVIIEVLSPSTASFDQVDKRHAYDSAGVRELWLIDVAGGVLTIYRHNGLKFDPPEIVRATGIVPLHALEDFPLDLRFIDDLRNNLESD